ncbi:MAG: alpha/beta fold hydrolase [Limnothrix sp. RL_2_0]|nr:alpha/beta fold hydrolase [Limnothrix sp. RL_2_0]
MTHTIYLHGFASSPQSRKAQYFAEQIPGLIIPDLNQNDFAHLTISRQIDQVEALLKEPSYIIGSSLGGLTAALLAEKLPDFVKKIVLMAPAFEFTKNWRKRLGEEALHQWQKTSYTPQFHYSYQTEIPLHYDFFRDAETYCDKSFTNQVPTLILHGIHDETVPISVSETYARDKAWVKFISLDSDHGLGDRLPTLCQETQTFLFGGEE